MDNNNYKISFVRNCDQKMICSNIFRDKNIDIKTKGFYGCILSLPDTQTHLSVREMMELVGQGELVVRNAINELIKFGYCVRNILYKKGKRAGVEYIFYEKSKLGQDFDFQNLENQNLENQNLENQNLENQNLENQNLENQNLENQNLENQNLENQNLEITTTSKKKGGRKVGTDILFADTPFYDPNFNEHDPNTYQSKGFQLFCEGMDKYKAYNLPIYYAKVRIWSAQGNKRKDWIAVAQGFITRDITDNKALKATIIPQPTTSNSKYTPIDDISTLLRK